MQARNPWEQYVHHMLSKWHWVDRTCNAESLRGQRGEQMVLWQSAARCHGDLPIGTGILALAAANSNGATTNIFDSSPSPLFMWAMNSNFPQTRKSELCKFLY